MPDESEVARSDAALVNAALWRRLAALVYDALLLLALLFLFSLVVVLLRGGNAVPAGTPWYDLGLVAVAFAFCCGFWVRGGQTLGMRSWRIKLVARDGGPVGLGRATLRFAASWLSLLPAGLGYWWALVDSERRCWHDVLSGTRVVLLPRPNARARASPT